MRAAVDKSELLTYSELNAPLHAADPRHRRARDRGPLLRQLRDQTVRHQFTLSLVPGRPSVSLPQHEAIVAAITARDPEAAEQAMHEHLQSVIEAFQALSAAATQRAASFSRASMSGGSGGSSPQASTATDEPLRKLVRPAAVCSRRRRPRAGRGRLGGRGRPRRGGRGRPGLRPESAGRRPESWSAAAMPTPARGAAVVVALTSAHEAIETLRLALPGIDGTDDLRRPEHLIGRAQGEPRRAGGRGGDRLRRRRADGAGARARAPHADARQRPRGRAFRRRLRRARCHRHGPAGTAGHGRDAQAGPQRLLQGTRRGGHRVAARGQGGGLRGLAARRTSARSWRPPRRTPSTGWSRAASGTRGDGSTRWRRPGTCWTSSACRPGSRGPASSGFSSCSRTVPTSYVADGEDNPRQRISFRDGRPRPRRFARPSEPVHPARRRPDGI